MASDAIESTRRADEPVGGGTADELYIGYLPAAPPGYARFVRRVVGALLLGAAALALALAALQGPFDAGSFDFGRETEATGIVRARPVPMLLRESAGAEPADTTESTRPAVLLVSPWKHGAGANVVALDGHRASLRGHRISSPQGEMLELVPGSLVDRGDAGVPSRVEQLGRFRLRGELVDSKCYLGVMKPGRGKPHRACAARCLSGGIPPMLLVDDASSELLTLVVATRDGSPLPEDLLARAGESVELEGDVELADGLLTLRLFGNG